MLILPWMRTPCPSSGSNFRPLALRENIMARMTAFPSLTAQKMWPHVCFITFDNSYLRKTRVKYASWSNLYFRYLVKAPTDRYLLFSIWIFIRFSYEVLENAVYKTETVLFTVGFGKQYSLIDDDPLRRVALPDFTDCSPQYI